MNTTNSNRVALPALFFLSVLTLVGCQDGGGSSGPGDSTPPASGGGAQNKVSGIVTSAQFMVADSDSNDSQATYIANDTIATAQTLTNPAHVGGYLNVSAKGPAGAVQQAGDGIDIYSVPLKAGQTISLTVSSPSTSDVDLLLLDANMQIIDGSFGVGAAESISVSSAYAQGSYYVAVVMCGSSVYSCDPLPSGYVGASTYLLSIADQANGQAVDALRLSDEFIPGQIVAQFAPAKAVAGVASRTLARSFGYDTTSPGTPFELLQVAAASTALTLNKSTGTTLRAKATTTTLAQDKLDTIMAIKALRRRADVASADLNYIRRAFTVPNDTYYSYQWDYRQMNLPAAWDTTTGAGSNGQDVIVAVVDTGVLLNHPDLIGKTIAGYDMISDAQMAGDGDGRDADPNDPGDKTTGSSSSFHGTHVAGTIAASSNNGSGVSGVAWNAKIMPVRVLGKGGGSSYDVMQGVLWAAGLDNVSGTKPARRADVINLSLGGGGYSASEQSAYTQAVNAGVIVVAAAGNSNSSTPGYPASYTGVVSVSAVDYAKNRAPYSNYGATVDVAAPGGDMNVDLDNDGNKDGVLSTCGNDSTGSIQYTYCWYQGTSMASPHVAGVVALMKAVNPNLTPSQFDALLASGALTQDIGATGRDDNYGYGLIDAAKAVAAALQASQPTAPALGVAPASLNFGASTTALTVTVSNSGGGTLHANIASADVAWLTLTPSVDSFGLGTYNVSVDRSTLSVGSHSAVISVTSDAGSATLPVTVQVNGAVVVTDTLRSIWVILVDVATDKTAYSAHATVTASGYQFSLNDVAPGKYYLYAGTDLNNDQHVCDAGEACAAYSSLQQPLVLDVTADGVSNLSLEATFVYDASVGAGLQSALPAAGRSTVVGQ